MMCDDIACVAAPEHRTDICRIGKRVLDDRAPKTAVLAFCLCATAEIFLI